MRLTQFFGKKQHFLLLLSVLALIIVPVVAQAQTSAFANAYGFGAAFAFSQQVSGLTFAATGTIGDADASAEAYSFLGCAYTSTWSQGLASGSAVAVNAGFDALAKVQVVAIGGMVSALAGTCP